MTPRRAGSLRFGSRTVSAPYGHGPSTQCALTVGVANRKGAVQVRDLHRMGALLYATIIAMGHIR